MSDVLDARRDSPYTIPAAHSMNIFIHKHGQQIGPFSEDEIYAMLGRHEVTAQDLAWTEGLPDWQPLLKLLPPSESAAAIQAPVSRFKLFWQRRLTRSEEVVIFAAAVLGAAINATSRDMASYLGQIIGGAIFLFIPASFITILVRGRAIFGVVTVAALTYFIHYTQTR